MNSLVKTLLLGTLVVSVGCVGIVGTDASLREVGTPASDDGLLGIWEVVRCPEPCTGVKGTRHQITRDDRGEYFIEPIDLEEEDSEKLPLGLVEFDGVVYIQPSSAEVTKAPSIQEAPGYVFPLRLERRGDELAISHIKYDELKQALAKSGYPLTTGFWTSVNCSPQELADFLTKHGNEIYSEGDVHRRVSDAADASGVNH